MNKLLETEKAYIAGLFDGEGCVSIIKDDRTGQGNHKSPSYSLILIISNNNKEVLEWLNKKTGIGNLAKRKNQRLYDWKLSRKGTEIFLNKIYPYLIIKREQAELAIEFCNHMNEKTGYNSKNPMTQSVLDIRESFRYKMSELKGTSGNRAGDPTLPNI